MRKMILAFMMALMVGIGSLVAFAAGPPQQSNGTVWEDPLCVRMLNGIDAGKKIATPAYKLENVGWLHQINVPGNVEKPDGTVALDGVRYHGGELVTITRLTQSRVYFKGKDDTERFFSTAQVGVDPRFSLNWFASYRESYGNIVEAIATSAGATENPKVVGEILNDMMKLGLVTPNMTSEQITTAMVSYTKAGLDANNF